MQSNIDSLNENLKPVYKENGIWAFLSLTLIFLNVMMSYSILNSLSKRNNLIIQLWKPSEDQFFFIVPTVVEICVILMWIMSPKNTEFKKVFRNVSIISTILYFLYLLIVLFLMGSKSAH